MSVKKFSITITGDNQITIDKIHESVANVTEGHLSTWEEATEELRTRARKKV